LCSILKILYTTHLSAIIPKSASNHHLYADDTQLLFSFSVVDLSYNITHLDNNITNVSNWMFSHFLSLNFRHYKSPPFHIYSQLPPLILSVYLDVARSRINNVDTLHFSRPLVSPSVWFPSGVSMSILFVNGAILRCR